MRFSPSCNCCGENCTIYNDEFDTLSASWSQKSGSWSSVSNKASVSTANAQMIYNVAQPDGEVSHRLVVVINGDTPGDKARAYIAANAAGTSYLAAEIELGDNTDSTPCGTLRVYEDATLLATVPIIEAENDADVTVQMCYEGGANGVYQRGAGILWVRVSTANYVRDVSVYASASGLYTGLGTGDTIAGTMTFDNYNWQKVYELETHPTCLDCPRCLIASYDWPDGPDSSDCEKTLSGIDADGTLDPTAWSFDSLLVIGDADVFSGYGLKALFSGGLPDEVTVTLDSKWTVVFTPTGSGITVEIKKSGTNQASDTLQETNTVGYEVGIWNGLICASVVGATTGTLGLSHQGTVESGPELSISGVDGAFDYLELTRCPGCRETVNCSNCLDSTAPEFFAVSLAGWGDSDCSTCDDLNGTHILGGGSGLCYWNKVITSQCHSLQVEIRMDVLSAFGTGIKSIEVTVTYTGFYLVSDQEFKFTKTYGSGETVDCMDLDSLPIPYDTTTKGGADPLLCSYGSIQVSTVA